MTREHETHTVIREADGDDLLPILEIGRITWPATYGPIAGDDYVQMGLAKWWTADATIPAIRAGRVLVAEVDGQVVGMVSFGPLDGAFHIWKLYLLPDFQRHGLGSRLMEAALDRARQDGHTQVRLSYLDGNEHSAQFYAKHGFEKYDVEAGSGFPDSIWVRRTLEGTS